MDIAHFSLFSAKKLISGKNYRLHAANHGPTPIPSNLRLNPNQTK
jgi:hypothetical protein